jgi:hypothetical protein
MSRPNRPPVDESTGYARSKPVETGWIAGALNPFRRVQRRCAERSASAGRPCRVEAG